MAGLPELGSCNTGSLWSVTLMSVTRKQNIDADSRALDEFVHQDAIDQMVDIISSMSNDSKPSIAVDILDNPLEPRRVLLKFNQPSREMTLQDFRRHKDVELFQSKYAIDVIAQGDDV